MVGRESTIVRVSSKGQIVIPVAVRRRLGLKTGQPLAIRATTQDEIVLRPADRDADAVDEMLRRLRAAARKLGAIRSGSFRRGVGASARARRESMSVGVIDAGIAIAWIRGATRSRKVLD